MSVTTVYKSMNIRIDQDEFLRAEAKRRGVSVNSLLRRMIDEYADRVAKR